MRWTVKELLILWRAAPLCVHAPRDWLEQHACSHVQQLLLLRILRLAGSCDSGSYISGCRCCLALQVGCSFEQQQRLGLSVQSHWGHCQHTQKHERKQISRAPQLIKRTGWSLFDGSAITMSSIHELQALTTEGKIVGPLKCKRLQKHY